MLSIYPHKWLLKAFTCFHLHSYLHCYCPNPCDQHLLPGSLPWTLMVSLHLILPVIFYLHCPQKDLFKQQTWSHISLVKTRWWLLLLLWQRLKPSARPPRPGLACPLPHLVLLSSYSVLQPHVLSLAPQMLRFPPAIWPLRMLISHFLILLQLKCTFSRKPSLTPSLGQVSLTIWHRARFLTAWCFCILIRKREMKIMPNS